MLSNAQQQPWGIVTVPDSPLCLVDRHFIEPIPGQEGARRKHPSHSSFVCNVSREALSDAGLGDSYKPKKFTSYWCSICKHALCIDPCFRLYHTKRTTQVKYWKLLERVWSLFNKMLNMFKQMLNMSNEATQSKWDNLTAWAYSTCTQVPLEYNLSCLVIVKIKQNKATRGPWHKENRR